MPTAVIPTLLRKRTNGRDRVQVSGRNIREVIADLDRQFPGFAKELIDDGDLKGSVAVSIDGEVGTQGLLDPVRETSIVHFLPAIGGG
jgi:sulfur-carrier protein